MKKLLGLFFEEDTGMQNGGKGGYFPVVATWGLILLAIGIVTFLASEVFLKKKGMSE